MTHGKRRQEWEQVAKLCQITLLPHISDSARRRMGEIHFIPEDLRDKETQSRGMSGGELKSMKGAFKNVETYKASDVRVVSKNEG